LIISNAITPAISGMFTAIGVYLAMKMIKHAEGNDAKAEIKTKLKLKLRRTKTRKRM